MKVHTSDKILKCKSIVWIPLSIYEMVSRLTPVFRRHKLLSLSELWCLELGTHTGAGGSWETSFMS